MHRLFFAFLFVLFAGLAGAQDADPIDYDVWETTASRAEVAVENARASDDAFAGLRAEVAGWRTQFQAAQTANATRITTIRNQIASLGDPPAEGATEAPELAARRSELNEQLTRLQAPQKKAEEAFSRANGVINEIDQIVRDRQAQKLLNLGPTPLNPALWGSALFELFDTLDSLWLGVKEALVSPTQRQAATANLPLSLFLFSSAIVLVLRARRWIETLALRIEARETHASAGFAGFLVSLGQVLLPVVGILLLVEAVAVTGFYGPRGEVLLDVLPWAGAIFFAARWLGGRLLPDTDTIETPLALSQEDRRKGRFYVLLLGLVLAVQIVVVTLGAYDQYPIETDVVLAFPFVLFGSVLLFLLGRMLRRNEGRSTGEEDTAPEAGAYGDRLIHIIGRAAILVGIVSPILAGIGYGAAAQALVFPTIYSLALLGVLALLQEFVRDGYAFVTRATGANRDALIPVLIGFALIVCSAPIFALIWGARITDLTEIWTRFKGGVTIGETVISPANFVTLLVVFLIGLLLTRLLQGALRTSILPKTKIDTGGRTAIVSGLGYIGIFLAVLIAVTAAGIDLSSLAIVAGALSVGIGFGLQNIVSNFVSGIILLIERPISEGDMIDVGGQMGFVRDISVRSTRIETFDRTDVIVPNADLVSGVVTNWTRGNLTGRLIVPIGVAYGTDTRKVEGILKEIIEAHPMVSLNPPPAVLFTAFGADSMDFEIRAILRDVNWKLSVHSDVNHEIASRFAQEGIEIPFAQRDVWLRNPEALGAPSKEEGSA